MNSLVIDTATTRTIVGIVAGKAEIFGEFQEGATIHGEALPVLVKRALEIENEIDQVIVGMGPGPFTGLRVGITFAQTFAAARNIPCIGKCSLDGVSIKNSGEYILTSDAKRKEIYWAKFSAGVRMSGPHLGTIDDVAQYSEPKYGFGFTESFFPSPMQLLQATEQFVLPLYLRNPDAVPVSEREK